MWNMMYDVMPTISEDSLSARGGAPNGDEANLEQLMVQMLDERDKLMDSLRETQERLAEAEAKLADAEKERDSLQRQLSANLPQVSIGAVAQILLWYAEFISHSSATPVCIFKTVKPWGYECFALLLYAYLSTVTLYVTSFCILLVYFVRFIEEHCIWNPNLFVHYRFDEH